MRCYDDGGYTTEDGVGDLRRLVGIVEVQRRQVPEKGPEKSHPKCGLEAMFRNIADCTIFYSNILLKVE